MALWWGRGTLQLPWKAELGASDWKRGTEPKHHPWNAFQCIQFSCGNWLKIGNNYKQQFLLQHQRSRIWCFIVRSFAYLPCLRVMCEFELRTKPKKRAVWLFQCSSECPPAFERRTSTLRPHVSSTCLKPVRGNVQRGEGSGSTGWLHRARSVLKGWGGRSAVWSESIRLLIVVQQLKKTTENQVNVM